MDEIQVFVDHLGDPKFLAHHFGGYLYLITFIWTALEGETFVIIAGLMAQKGYLNIYALFMAAWTGSFLGDQVVFALGRKYGTRILHHFPKLEPGVDRAIGWLEKYAIAFILSYRFIYGVRNVSSIAVGLSHISWRTFALWNAVAACVWAAAFSGFGYLFGEITDQFRPDRKPDQSVAVESVRQITLSMLGLFAFIVLIKIGIMFWQRSSAKKRGKRKSHK